MGGVDICLVKPRNGMSRNPTAPQIRAVMRRIIE